MEYHLAIVIFIASNLSVAPLSANEPPPNTANLSTCKRLFPIYPGRDHDYYGHSLYPYCVIQSK